MHTKIEVHHVWRIEAGNTSLSIFEGSASIQGTSARIKGGREIENIKERKQLLE